MTLHERALLAAKNYCLAEAELIEALQEIEKCGEFRKQGYTSLHSYAVEALRLSSDTAYNFITVARKARQVPALKQAIANAELTVSKARKIASILTLESQEWIAKAIELPQRELERQVARVNPQEALPDRVKHLDGERVQLTITVSVGVYERLKRIQDLESSRTSSAATMEQTLDAAAETHLEKHDPVRKAERARPPKLVVRRVSDDRKRQSLPAAIEHEISKRDQGQCTAVVNGKRCTNRRWLEVHHIVPVSEGGTNDLSNLTTLCSAHHHAHHARAG